MATGVLTFTLRADAAARELLRTGEAPPDLADGPAPPSPLELYCDFTGVLGSESDRLSRACVERDLDRVRLAFRDRMTFVVVENALPRIPPRRSGEPSCPLRRGLFSWHSFASTERVESYAEGRIDDLVAEARSSRRRDRTRIWTCSSACSR